MNKKTNYYIIKQTIPHLKPNTLKVVNPCNFTHLKKLISYMFGKIEVFLCNEEDNSRIDVSKELGVLDFNIYEHEFHKMRKLTFVFSHDSYSSEYFEFFSMKEPYQQDFEKFFMFNTVYKIKKMSSSTISFILSSSLEDHKKRNNYGNAYEAFISKKYEEQNYQVELNGIKKSFDDGGIDIIAVKENSIILVQCKNWAMSNNYKITQKDLRAFVGDCFLYLKDKPLDKKVSYHFIVSHEDILTGSAKIFLEKHKFIKFKCVPFEK